MDIYLYDYNNHLNKLISKTSKNLKVAEHSSSARVVEDTAVSPPKVGVVFSGRASLTGVAEHPGYYEVFLYQQDDLDKFIFKDGFE